jgi:hypothetical protein
MDLAEGISAEQFGRFAEHSPIGWTLWIRRPSAPMMAIKSVRLSDQPEERFAFLHDTLADQRQRIAR